ncbi:MAG: hypothetical protein AAB731_02885 [Patescibacteria group bacterium]
MRPLYKAVFLFFSLYEKGVPPMQKSGGEGFIFSGHQIPLVVVKVETQNFASLQKNPHNPQKSA